MSEEEKMATSVVTALLTFGVSLGVAEIKFLLSVEGQVEGIQSDWRSTRGYLEEADAKSITAGHFQVLEARDAALNAEDLRNEFHYKIENIRRRGFFGKLRENTSVVKGKRLHRIGTKATKIQERITRVSAALKQVIDGTVGQQQPQGVIRVAISNVNDGVVVNLTREVSDLNDLLLLEEAERMRVVTIVGIPGVGKSTLARRLYDHETVKRSYDHRAWVCVPRHCDQIYLLQRTLVAVTSPSDEELNGIQEITDPKSLEEKLREFLINKKFLVVLVGVWDIKDWDRLKPAFPESRGSTVMLTIHESNDSRLDASFVPTCRLQPLALKHSRELLLTRTFQTATFPKELKKFLFEVAPMCKGHPVAVVELGNQLAGIKYLEYWRSVVDKIPFCSDPSQVAEKILKSSYYNLPFHLKPCFLYLALFPEYCEISTKKLIRLWIAEGFVKRDEHHSIEEEAEEYLRHLIEIYRMVDRGQTSSKTNSFKTIKTGIHKWELAVRMAHVESFSRIIYPLAVGSETEDNKKGNIRPRRYAVHPATNITTGLVSLLESNPSLHSLFVYSGVALNELGESAFNKNRKLRVLDLEKVSFEGKKLPDKLKKLVHLRYFGLRKVELQSLPDSICKLRNLRTLYLRDSTIGKITTATWSMQEMRHLVFWHCKAEGTLRVKVNMSHMETLKIDSRYIANISDILNVKKEFGEMVNLRSLGIMGLKEYFPETNWLKEYLQETDRLKALVSKKELQMDALSKFLNKGSQTLQSLTLRSSETNVLSVQQFPQFGALTKLFLDGILPGNWGQSSLPPNLTKLTLMNLKLEYDPMPELRTLKELKILRLQENVYTGETMVCSDGDFPQLEVLQLCGFNNLKDWRVNGNAMQSLETLHIENMKKLANVPGELLVRATLKLLEISGMTKAFEDSLRVETQPTTSLKFHNTRTEQN